MIKGIMEDTETYIDLDDDGFCTVQGLTDRNVQDAVTRIMKIVETKIVEFHLQDRQMRMLIGKGGSTINAIQERTGARIDTERNGTKVTVTAIDASVLNRTLSEIQNAISFYESTIQVPSHRIGRVVGRGGSTINMIKNSTKTWLNIAKDNSGRISVEGASEYDVNRAITMIRSQAGSATVLSTTKGTLPAYTELRSPTPAKFERKSVHKLEPFDYRETAPPKPKVSTPSEPAASKPSVHTKSILLSATQLAKLQKRRGGFIRTLLGGGKSTLEEIRSTNNVRIRVEATTKTIYVTGKTLAAVQKAINEIQRRSQ